MYTHIYIFTNICTYLHIYIHTCNTYMYTHIYRHKRIHLRIITYRCIHIHIHVRVNVYIYIYIYVHMYTYISKPFCFGAVHWVFSGFAECLQKLFWRLSALQVFAQFRLGHVCVCTFVCMKVHVCMRIFWLSASHVFAQFYFECVYVCAYMYVFVRMCVCFLWAALYPTEFPLAVFYPCLCCACMLACVCWFVFLLHSKPTHTR